VSIAPVRHAQRGVLQPALEMVRRNRLKSARSGPRKIPADAGFLCSVHPKSFVAIRQMRVSLLTED